MWDNKGYVIDMGMVEAMQAWFDYGLDPGSCTEQLLRGNYVEAYKSAHTLIKPHWSDHVAYVEECVPAMCRGENYDNWKGYDDYLARKRCRELIGEELDKVGEIFRV